MSKYTTGELAKLCGVSVRTVQFYDVKKLLEPTELTEGGRRLYSENDLKKLKLICVLKAMGLSLDSIRDILSSKTPSKVLRLLLEEQTKRIDAEIEEMKKQREVIHTLRESIGTMDTFPVNSISDIEQMMTGQKKLKYTYVTLAILGVLMDLIQIYTIFLWITRGIWWPFAVGMPLVILCGVLLVGMYYRNTAYICPECNSKFKPKLKPFFFAKHTPKTRKLQCPVCSQTGYCVETYSD